MSDPSQPTPKTSEELRKLRDEFTAKAAKEAAELSKQIAAAEQAEREQKLKDDFKKFMPGDDKSILKGHDFVFLINKTSDMGGGGNSAIGTAFATARDIFMTVKSLGDMTVSASIWGSNKGAARDIPLVEHHQINSATKGTKTEEKYFQQAAQALLFGNMTAAPSDRQKHYVIVCNGNISGNVDHLVPVIEAATKINPKITIDFVVCNSQTGNIEGLLQRWNDVTSAPKPNLVKTGAAKEISSAIMNVVKARIAGEIYTPQAQPTAATPKTTPSV